MGDHYLPQYYLKGFSQKSGNRIWVFDKKDKKSFSTHVKNVANEKRFYSPMMEQYLANEVEGPANIAIKKIRNRNECTEKDKDIVAKYMAVMINRVPRGKARLKELAPSILKKLNREMDEELSIIASEKPERAHLIQDQKDDIKRILDRYADDPPKSVWLDSISVEQSPKVIELIKRMTWRFLTYDKRPAFLTSDNPVFYFTEIGIGKTESEITFPISSHIALWATWRADLLEGYHATTEQAVKEINRRTVGNATRYVFHERKEAWILPFVLKGGWQRHRFL